MNSFDVITRYTVDSTEDLQRVIVAEVRGVTEETLEDGRDKTKLHPNHIKKVEVGHIENLLNH